MRLLFTSLLSLFLSYSFFGQSPCKNQTSVTYQGYEYDIVEIGDQCWFAENCRYLPEVSASINISDVEPCYYVYNYNGSDIEIATSTENYQTYGVLYNWPAVMTEKICPTGWHIPSDSDWLILEIHLGMTVEESKSDMRFDTNQGVELKSKIQWNGTNSTGFNAIGGGLYSNKLFMMLEDYCGFWTTSEIVDNHSLAWKRGLFNYDSIDRNMESKNLGFSARCIKD